MVNCQNKVRTTTQFSSALIYKEKRFINTALQRIYFILKQGGLDGKRLTRLLGFESWIEKRFQFVFIHSKMLH